eukprot:TRINITY_DN15698_c0_g1_i1.p1 TRINITY_DN15698_c0_g1~~TRINITY_DN15698_c0_g1_i1.p1  ORF type:complete len:476 (-),score=90.74 TRINITY_DN15698_c0_g1_i1:81-1454(-)
MVLPMKVMKVGKLKASGRASPTSSSISSQLPMGCKAGVDLATLRGYADSMEKVVRAGAIPGCASVVIRNNEVVHSLKLGFADVEAKTKFDFDTLCRMFCATKSYIAVAFMTLVDEGKASPDDRLDKYVPSFRDPVVRVEGTNKTVPAKRPILLRHLMSHTSGIAYTPDLGEKPEDADSAAYQKLQSDATKGAIKNVRAFVDQMAKIPLCDHPGHKYNYSFSFDVLGRVVEVIMGKSLDKCLRERVFDPLGMKSTMWSVPDAQLGRLAACYSGKTTWGHLYGKGHKPIRPRPAMFRIDGKTAKDSHWRKGKHCRVLSGGGFMGYLYGGLVSSVNDTTRFVRMLLNYGVADNGRRLLKKTTVIEMEKNRLRKSVDGDDKVCFLGNIGTYREGTNEYGMGGAACTYWNIDRADGTATVWFTQHVDMPEFDQMKGVDVKKADMWGTLHRAVLAGKSAKGKK